MDALMRAMRDERIDASISVSAHMQFQGDDELEYYRMVTVYIV
jgi:hypothetical protein